LLLDTSGSMRGEPIESVTNGLQSLISTLKQDPFALETVCISIITFDKDVEQKLTLTELENLQLPDIIIPESGPTHLGKALELLCKRVDQEVIRTSGDKKGDWMPLLFVMTDGSPSDLQLYRQMIPEVKKRNFANILACAAGSKANEGYLRELTDQVYSLDTMDSSTFKQFFQWISVSVSMGNRSVGASSELMLPPPPPEIRRVV